MSVARHRFRSFVVAAALMVAITLGALGALGALFGAPVASAQGAREAPQPLRILASAGVRGRLAEARCEDVARLEPTEFARLAGQIVPSLDRVPVGFAFDSGGLLSPHGVARFALAEAPSRLAEMVEALGYRALALGEDDLESPPSDLAMLARALRERAIPVVASNLVCAEAGRDLCDALVTAADGVSLFHMGELTLAFLAFTRPAALDHLPPEQAAALTLLPLETSVPLATRRARELGADLVIASIDDGEGAEAFGRTLALASSLAEPERPDFIMSARGGSQVMFARPVTEDPPVIAAPVGGLARIDVRELGQGGRSDLRVRMMAPGAEPAAAIVAFAEELAPRYCEAWAGALPHGALSRPIDAAGLLALVSSAARSSTGADLVVLPRDAVRREFSPMREGALSRGDIEVGVRKDDPLVVADVDGKWLKALAKSAAAKEALHFPGLVVRNEGRTGERVTLYEATVEDDGRFAVVTTKPLSRAGPLLPAGGKFRPTDHTLRSNLLAHLGREQEDDPRDSIVDPARTMEWYGRVMADANFGGTVVRNPGGYEESQLDRKDSLAFGVTTQADFGGASRVFGWENRFDLRYRIIQDETQGTVEGDDFLSLISRVKWLGLRADRPKVWIPEPFAEMYVESEFTQGSTRDFHHLFVRPTVGGIFRLIDPVLFSVRGGFQLETLDPNRVAEPGMGFRLEASQLEVLKEGDTRLVLRGFIDYFWSSLGRRNTHTLRSTLDVSYALGKRFGVGLLLVVFGLRDEGNAFSVATNATAFLRASFYGRTR